MKQLDKTLLTAISEKERLKLVRKKAHAAHCMALRDYDWMSLDPKTACKIHALLPRDV